MKMASKKIFRQLFQTKISASDSESKLARVLSSLDLTLLGIGSTLGVGIYVLAGKVARESAGPAVIISFLIAAVASAFAGFCYAEFGARVPKAGSAYSYCYYTVGEFIAFLIGWNLIMEYVIGSASVTKAFSTYLDELTGHKISEPLKSMFPMTSDFLGEFPDFLAFGVVLLLAICLSFGFKGSSKFNSSCTAVNLCIVIFVIIAGAINAKHENWSISKNEIPPEYQGGEGGFAPFGITGIIKGAATCFYGFIGFDCVATMGEEAKTPKKSIPIAITMSLFVIFLAYFGVSAVLTLMWPYYSQNVDAPLSSVFEWIGWTAAKWVVSVGALFGLLPSLLGSLIPLPRIIYAMAYDGLIYKKFGKISETYHSPVIGTISSGLFTGAMAMVFNLSQLIDMMSIGTLLAYTIVAACVLILRYRRSEEDDGIDELNDLKFGQKLWMHLFNAKQFKTPSQFSSRLVTIAVFFYCVVILGLMSCIVFVSNDLLKETWSIAVLSVLIFLAVGLLIFIGLQPKSQKKLYFAVPFVPVIPAFSMACNTYLILMLDLFTWIRFGIWMVIGILIYFTYGVSHSNLNKFQGMKLWSSKQEKNENGANSAMDAPKPKILSFFDLLSIGVGGSWGIGASVLIGEIIKNKAGPAVVVSIFLAGVTALIGGLCFSEFGARFLKVNSTYAYSYFCNRETVAFILGWALLLEYVAGTASAAKGIIIFTDAITDYKISDVLKNVAFTNFPDVFPYFDFFSLGIITIITIFIAIGLKDSMNIKKIFIVCNMVLVSSIIIAGAFKADIKNWQTKQTPDEYPKNGFAPFGVFGVVNGAALAFCGFIGFDAVSVSGTEVIKQKRNLPAAILITILITFVAFIGVGVILTLMLPYDKLNSHAAAVFAFQEMGWTSLKWITAVGTFFGFQTSLFGAIFPLPRIIYDMANDGLLFSFLGYSDSTSKIPVAASITGGLLAAVAASFFSFQKLVSLTIIGVLFVCTILSINVLLLRYSPKFDDEMLSESWKNLVNTNREVTVKAIVQNYFNFKEKHPTNLTGTIILGNVFLFCISSIGLNIILNVYHDRIVQCSTEVVISGGVLLGIMIFSFISLTCQPKSQKFVPFKVPLVPFIPCLGIFLNTFLMLTFESLTWILFAIWMAAGVLPHFVWIFLKYLRGERRENSLYEINKSNAIKLNKSIWKINLEKKSFYEGAINPVFSDELEEKYIESGTDRFCEVEQHYEETSPQLKQAEIISTSELIVEEKAEPLEYELELNFIRADSAENVNVLTEKENIQWECVAEIHSEEESPLEIVELEIVDNTYNFLTEVSEELSKDNVSLKEAPKTFLEEEYLNRTENAFNGNCNSEKDFNLPLRKLYSSSENLSEFTDSKTLEKTNLKLLKEEFLKKINSKTSDKNNTGSKKSGDIEKFELQILEESKKENENSLVGDFTKSQASINSNKNQNEEQIVNLIIKTFYEAHKGKMILNSDDKGATETADCNPALDEQNKIKEFKEKLNQLLKNQINNDANKTINSLTKSPESDDADQNNEKNKNGSINNIKTLNKSQIKGKLELLLAKGPPKRMPLSSSFNIKIKEADKENTIEKEEDEIQKRQNNTIVNIRDSEQILIRTSPILAESIRKKILSLKSVDTVDC